MYGIFVKLTASGKWVDFIALALELKYISQKEADCIRDYRDLEEVAKVISYFGNELQILPAMRCHVG